MSTITPAQAKVDNNPLQLHDIHLPEQISDYPIAYGWWLLAILLLVTLFFIGYQLRKRAKHKLPQQQAIKQLKNTPSMKNNEVIALLKWAAMQYFPRIELAKIYGEQFQQFLLQQPDGKHHEKFTELTKEGFKNQYQVGKAEATIQSFQQGALLWLTQALPPKTHLKKQTNITTNEPAEAIK